MDSVHINNNLSSEPSMTWKVHPMKDNPLKGVIFWVTVIIVIFAVYWNIVLSFSKLQSIIFTFIASIFLLFSLSSFYLPTWFTINLEGIELRRWFYVKKMSWGKIRSVKDEVTGLFCSPFPVRTRLENYRGIFLLYRNNQDEIISIMKSYKPDLPGLPKSLELEPEENNSKIERET